MALNGIDATLRQIASQLPKGTDSRTNTDTFQKLIDTLSSQIKTAIEEAVSGSTSRGTAPVGSNPFLSAASTTMPVESMPAESMPTEAAEPVASGRTTSALSSSQQRWLKQSGGALLEQLPGDTSAFDPLYNQRADALRDGLDLDKIEQHLKSKAAEMGVSYHRSDLEGILRNAGYGRNNLGGTEMYMDTVEKFIGNAEENYRQRSQNVPGQNA